MLLKKMKGTTQEEILVSLADVWHHLKQRKKTILFFVLAGMCIAFCRDITRGVTYTAKATFRDKTGTQSSFGGQVQALLSSVSDVGDSGGGSTIAVMKSRKVMSLLVKKLHLQAALSEEVPQDSWGSIFKNVKLLRLDRSEPPTDSIFPDAHCAIAVEDIQYTKPFLAKLRLHFISEDRFTVEDPYQMNEVFCLGEVVRGHDFSFKVVKKGRSKLSDTHFSLKLYPMDEVCVALSGAILIERDKKDRNLIALHYTSGDPSLAASVLNELMKAYQVHLDQENKAKISEQLGYLESRRKEMYETLKADLGRHVNYVQDHIRQDNGFVDVVHEMDFISGRQSEFLTRLLEIQLELSLLESAQHEDYLYNTEKEDTLGVYKLLFLKRRDFQQRRDLLLVGLSHEENNAACTTEQWNRNASSLKKTRENLQKVKYFHGLLSSNAALSSEDEHAFKSLPHYDIWKTQFDQFREERDPNEKESYKKALSSILNNQKKLLRMQVEILEERLIRQKETDLSLEGIPLVSIEDLSSKLSIDLEKLQMRLMRFSLAEQRLKDPSVEMSSIGDIIEEDEVVEDTIKEASSILKQLHNVKNISAKEAERLRSELNYQRAFFFDYISQTKETHAQEEIILKKKMRDLSHVLLDLYQQEISVISDQLETYKNAKIAGLHHEKTMIDKELAKLNERVADLPNKWVAEKNMQLEIDENKILIAQIAQLVETTNISSNLSRIEARPLDAALIPIYPDTPKVGLNLFIGGMLGLLLSSMSIAVNSFFHGVRTTKNNLLVIGQEVLAEIRGEIDLLSARGILSFVKGSGKVIQFITGGKEDPAPLVAHLASKKGQKVLIMHCTQLQARYNSFGPQNTLQDFLQRKVAAPYIQSLSSGYDYLYGGSYNPYAVEEMHTQRFSTYLESLKKEYDWIFMVLPVAPTSDEATHLRAFADKLIVTLHHEKIHDIRSYLQQRDDGIEPTVAFVLASQQV